MDDLAAFLRARLDEDEAWARAANQAYPYADGARAPTTGVHWRWVAGEQWETVHLDPALDPYVADGDRCHLATVEEWPVRGMRQMPRTYGSTEEMDSAAAGHIARHDPARVLAEVEAKRRLLDEVARWRHTTVGDCWYSCAAATEENGYEDRCCDEDRIGKPCDCGLDARRRAILMALALPFADHPGFRDEWRPS